MAAHSARTARAQSAGKPARDARSGICLVRVPISARQPSLALGQFGGTFSLPLVLAGLLVLGTGPLTLGVKPALAQSTLRPRTAGPTLVKLPTEKAIDKGIRFLLSIRGADGEWRNSRSPRRGRYPCANTALVGLVLLANGNTPTRGPHAKVVSEITDYLLNQSRSSGLITATSYSEQRTMYPHAFALTFLATVLGQEGRPERRESIKSTLREGIRLCARAQTDDGGWGYQPNYYEDEGTLVVTQLMGLRACRDAGVPVPKSMIDRGIAYIRASTDQRSGRVRYRVHSNRWRKGVTCASIVALWQAGEYDTPLIRKIMTLVNRDIAPDTGEDLFEDEDHGEYIEFYLAQAMHVQGGELWKNHYRRISSWLTAEQRRDGSWYGDDSSDYGQIYSTAIACLILQMPYQRLPAFQR